MGKTKHKKHRRDGDEAVEGDGAEAGGQGLSRDLKHKRKKKKKDKKRARKEKENLTTTVDNANDNEMEVDQKPDEPAADGSEPVVTVKKEEPK